MEVYVVVHILQRDDVAEHHLRKEVGFVADPNLDSLVLSKQVHSLGTNLLACLDQLWLSKVNQTIPFVEKPIL